MLQLTKPIFAMLGLILAAAAGYGTYFAVQGSYVEYEYTFTNGELDVDKIVAKKKRTAMVSTDIKKFTAFGKYTDGMDESEDMTVVIASHNLRELEELCDRICLIHKGKLLLEREIDEIKLGLRKVQVAFTEVPDNSFFEEINVINLWRNGNIFNLTIRGTEDEFMPKLEERKPLYISAVPMTLEEIFISEMGAAGYDAENII